MPNYLLLLELPAWYVLAGERFLKPALQGPQNRSDLRIVNCGDPLNFVWDQLSLSADDWVGFLLPESPKCVLNCYSVAVLAQW